jgi:hypothetical protein
MRFSRRFYRSAAVCSAISAVTTLMLIFLPRVYGPLRDFDARIAAVHHPAYLARAWAYLVHPFLCLAAALGVAASRRRAASGAAAVGFLGVLLWAFTEAAQQALTLTTFDRWRRAYPSADEAARSLMRTQIATYDALWDALYVLLLIGFIVGNAFLAVALWKTRGLARIVAILYVAAAGLGFSDLSPEFGGPGLPPVLDAWLYPALQPAARFLIGVYLWRTTDPEDGSVPAPL